jgi:hypothetical protein
MPQEELQEVSACAETRVAKKKAQNTSDGA